MQTLSEILNKSEVVPSGTASDVPFTPTGSVAAANVQGAIAEVDSEKEPSIAASTIDKFFRGDKSFESITANNILINTRLVTASDTVVLTDNTVRADATAGAITLTLPQASTCSGYIFRIKKINSNSNNAIIEGNASETIDGSLQAIINVPNQSLAIQSNGTSWDII